MKAELAGRWADHFGDRYREDLCFSEDRPFVVCSMFTPDNPRLLRCADRLARSCEKYRLPHIIYRVPEVHKSMSPSGGEDLCFSKPSFIRYNLERFPGRAVLYLDADMVFMHNPEDIFRAGEAGHDFAVYNWLSDEHNEAYLPVNGILEKGNRYSELYRFSHSINFVSDEQLICSGGVQFYGNSEGAGELLDAWFSFISAYPDFADDEGLDYVYNNQFTGDGRVRPFWLDKSYIRFPWWPHIRPVILHPALHPARERRRIDEVDGKKRFYPERCRKNMTEFVFPADYIIDTKNCQLLKFENDLLVDRKAAGQRFFVYPGD